MLKRLLEAVAVWHHNFGYGQMAGAPRCVDCGRLLLGEAHAPIRLCKKHFAADPDKAFERFPQEAAEWRRRTFLTSPQDADAPVWELVDELKREAWQEEKNAFALIQAGRPGEAAAHQKRARQLLDEAQVLALEAQQVREHMQQAARESSG